MFHANTRKVIEGWNVSRDGRHAPARSDIQPTAFSDLLPQIFILGRAEAGRELFRLAGGLLVDLHDRDLRGVDFFSLWLGVDRDQARVALETARRTGVPMVLDASGWSAVGDEVQLEITMAPLVGPTGEMDRVLGLYQPTTSPRRLFGARIETLTLNGVRPAEPATPGALAGVHAPAARDRSHLRLVAIDGARLD